MAIDNVPPLIAAQLNYLVSHCPFSVKVEQMWSGSKNPSLLDRFTLVVPYCLDYIRWDLIYHAMYPLAAPDVIFGPEDESFQPYRVAKRNSLTDWNSLDPKRLLSLIVELRDAYVAYQRMRIGEVDDDRLKFEVSTMPSREGIEMHMISGTGKSEEVKFAVPLLDMDFNKLIPGSTWKHPQKIYLQVIFLVGKRSSTAPPPRLKLISSSELKVLFSPDDFKLQPWLDGMCTAEYLPTLEEMLVSQIKDAVSSVETRRKFIMALVPHFGRPIEADLVLCRRATFFASSGLCTFLVHFSFPLQFPRQQPAIILQSSQNFTPHGAPVRSPIITEFPWSPRWEPAAMADRIFDFVADEAVNFKKYVLQQVESTMRGKAGFDMLCKLFTFCVQFFVIIFPHPCIVYVNCEQSGVTFGFSLSLFLSRNCQVICRSGKLIGTWEIRTLTRRWI